MSLIQPHYEINVSLNGKHFFATDSRSILFSWDLKKIYPIFKEKFPKSEGYELSIMKVHCSGETIDADEMFKKELGDQL